MFEDSINKKIVVYFKSNSNSMFGILISENDDSITLEFKDGTPFTIPKSDISYTRPFVDKEAKL